jgi:hypothetical protein
MGALVGDPGNTVGYFVGDRDGDKVGLLVGDALGVNDGDDVGALVGFTYQCGRHAPRSHLQSICDTHCPGFKNSLQKSFNNVGCLVGDNVVGLLVGDFVGAIDGSCVGFVDGDSDGVILGVKDGDKVGVVVGCFVGDVVGETVGIGLRFSLQFDKSASHSQ